MLRLAWRNIIHNPLGTALTSILFAVSITIIILLGIVGHQLEDKFSVNRKKIHLVVGAPGSKLDLILSSVYHISPPIQNIKISDIGFILRQPSLSVVPIALGDHYAYDPNPENQSFEDIEQRRIVGTDSSYLNLYDVHVEKGRVFNKPMEAVIGYEVQSLGLNIGDTFTGTHGVSGHGGHVHEEQRYTVVGILEPSGTVLDQLILCDIRSVWMVHEGHEHTGAKIVTQESILSKPDLPEAYRSNIIPEEEQVKIEQEIQNKISNIISLLKLMPKSTDENFWRHEKEYRSDILRIRSNFKAIRSLSRTLIENKYALKYGRQDSIFTVSDSLRLFSARNLEMLADKFSLLEKLQNNRIIEIEQYTAELEQITYNVLNAYDLARHDSLLHERRKLMTGLKQNLNKHYLLKYENEEVTSLLITYKGSMGIDVQRIIGEHHPELNAAPVEIEVNKLYQLIQPGVIYLQMLAYLIMIISGISILISLVKALRERKYEMALLRVMGATRFKIFLLVILEGLILSLAGFLLGFLLSHIIAEIMAGVLESRYHYHFTGFIFLKTEWLVLIGTLGIGFVSALVPAIMAIYTNISSTLSKK